MRLLGEIIIIGALIYLGWEKPFTQWIHGPPLPVVAATPAPPPRPIVRATDPVRRLDVGLITEITA